MCGAIPRVLNKAKNQAMSVGTMSQTKCTSENKLNHMRSSLSRAVLPLRLFCNYVQRQEVGAFFFFFF